MSKNGSLQAVMKAGRHECTLAIKASVEDEGGGGGFTLIWILDGGKLGWG